MNTKRVVGMLAGLAVMGLCLQPTLAKETHPFDTQDANTIPKGQVDIRLGAELYDDFVQPFTPDNFKSDYYKLPTMEANIGVSDNVELQVSWDCAKIDNAFQDKYGAGDPRIYTKIKFVDEKDNMPAIGMRVGFKIPSASYDDGLGTNEADVMASLLASKKIGPVEAHANVGIAILGNPLANSNQDDVMTYGLMVGYPVNEAFYVGAEVTGQACSTKENDRALVRVGVQYNVSDFTVDAGLGAGLNESTEDYRGTLGVTYHWKAF